MNNSHKIHVEYARTLNNTVGSNKIANDKFPQSKELTLNKKSLLYGALTALAFLGIAATLYFSSSKQSMQIASLIFAAASIFAGLIAGLMPYWCAEPDQDLSSTGITAKESESKAKS
ncbi:hypothetical protein [Candidatus Mesenet endosymbiont of Agriotes lineatus]|uniref:hypothetical protein n=1 Tax=Candidatus Mesenet endosymbiont of Agriotes lineatus TaxID=3077948 RepID=UPI0030D2EF7F